LGGLGLALLPRPIARVIGPKARARSAGARGQLTGVRPILPHPQGEHLAPLRYTARPVTTPLRSTTTALTGPRIEPSGWIGRVIDDRYRIMEVLGEGGMGAVFVAEHLKLHKQVAFKTIRAEFAANSEAEARFVREATATAQIDHPHVASAIDFGHLPEGGAYLVIQLVRGEGLGHLLHRGPLATPQLCELGAQIADALAAAHAAGIVHRDLKPDNVMLERRSDSSIHARVLDFGIARVSEEDGAVVDTSQPITRAGAVIGTPGYMAPEQAVGGAIDHRVDLYALGVILWEAAAGRSLWRAETLTEMFMAQIGQPAPSLGAEVAGLPAEFVAIVDQLLARNSAERPASAVIVRETLRRLGREPAPPLANLPVPPPPRATIDHRRWLGFAGVGLGLVVLIALAFDGGDDAEVELPPPQQVAATPAGAATPRAGLPSRQSLLAEVPPAYVDAAQVLLLSEERKERQRAGTAIADAPEADKAAIPEYLRNLAWIEKVSSCDTKRTILLRIETADDLRALWALRILDRSPRDGCSAGWFGRKDCLGCLREDLARITARFEGRAGP
jgi:serine/threonine protein kinase